MEKFPIFKKRKERPSGLSLQYRVDMIVSAIANEWWRVGDRKVVLERPEANSLDFFPRWEALEALEYLQNTEHIIKIAPENYPKIIRGRIGPPFSGDPSYEETEVPEMAPLTFEVLSTFDDWYAVHKSKKETDLKDLEPSDLAKIQETIADMDERLRMNPTIEVKLKWFPGSSTRDHNAREDSLTFLKSKSVVSKYEFHYSPTGEGSVIKVFINFRNYKTFKEKFKKHMEQFPSRSSSPKPTVPAKILQLEWRDIEIKFGNYHDVRIKIKGEVKKSDYKAMGFENKKNHQPNAEWQLLSIFANKRGRIQCDDPSFKGNLPKTKQLLAKSLCSYFKIDCSPFVTHKKEGIYEAKLQLSE